MGGELDVAGMSLDGAESIVDAIDDASDQDKITWIVENGKRIAAIVPVDVAEAHEKAVAGVLSRRLG